MTLEIQSDTKLPKPDTKSRQTEHIRIPDVAEINHRHAPKEHGTDNPVGRLYKLQNLKHTKPSHK